MNSLKLYLITDSNLLNGRDFYEEIENALIGGVTMLQLREKNSLGKEFLEKAIILRKLTRKYNVKFIINDRVDIAMICDADGVHIGQEDIPCKDVRRILGDEKIVGVTTKTVEQAIQAKNDGATYIGVGDMFGTSTKKNAIRVSFDMLSEIKKVTYLPIVGIGGVTLENMEKLKALNVDGYGVISAILKSSNIKEECEKWIDAI